MKNLANIFELIEGVIPDTAQKTIVFCEVEPKSYEIFYYSYFTDGGCKQCYEIEADGNIDSTILKRGFEEIALYIRECKEYQENKRNVVTVDIAPPSKKVEIEQFEKSVGLYKIKKEWKAKNIEQNA